MNKILFITKNLSSGGTERTIVNLSNFLTSKNYEVGILKFSSTKSHYTLHSKIKVYTIYTKSLSKLITKLSTYLKVRRNVKKIKPDIIIIMPEEIAIYALLFLLGIRIPIIVSERNDPYKMPWKKVSRILRHFSYKLSNGFVFQTENARDYFNPKIIKKSLVIPNSLDLDKLPSPHIGERSKTVVSVGRLFKQKNFNLLIDAFVDVHLKLPEYTLLIYGDGPLKDELNSKIKNLEASSYIKLMGNTNDVLKLINDASVFVLCSDYEGIPNALMEAIALGIPSISTDSSPGGAKMILNSGEYGKLIPVGDKSSLINSIINIIQDEQICKSSLDNSFKFREKYSISNIGELWIGFIRDTIEKAKRS